MLVNAESGGSAAGTHALAGACQLVAGDVLRLTVWPDFPALVHRFAQIPDPSSYAEAVMEIGLVMQFTQRLGDHLHRHAHGEDRGNSCLFRPPTLSIEVEVSVDRPSAWNAGQAVQAWLVAYEAAFIGAHRNDLVLHAKRRMQIDRYTLTIGAVAREIGCSVAVLQRRFAENCGETLSGYRQRMRAAAALELLHASDAKVETVARMVGRKSKKDLYKVLARLTKMSPAAIRALPPADAFVLAAHIVARQARENPPP
jgi:AraC-like DNA-binding protein